MNPPGPDPIRRGRLLWLAYLDGRLAHTDVAELNQLLKTHARLRRDAVRLAITEVQLRDLALAQAAEFDNCRDRDSQALGRLLQAQPELTVQRRSAAFTPLHCAHRPWVRCLLRRTEVRAPEIMAAAALALLVGAAIL